MSRRIGILDNHDSFTYNLAQAFLQTGAQTAVWRDHPALLGTIAAYAPTHLVISPGPMRPTDHPAIVRVLTQFAGQIPLLGVCLGMQGMNEWAGGTIRRDHPPMHGKTSDITHDGAGLFTGLPSPCTVARYHSLVLDRVASDFAVTARVAGSDTVMAIAHRTRPMWGVQFHPESYLSPHGQKLLENFLQM